MMETFGALVDFVRASIQFSTKPIFCAAIPRIRSICSMTSGELSVAILRGRFPREGIDILLSEESVCLVLSKENEQRPLDELPYISRRTDREFEIRAGAFS